MKVVLDTNVFISGIHWRGDSAKIIDAWIDDKFELISSEDVLQEQVKLQEAIISRRYFTLDKSYCFESNYSYSYCSI
ncbi:MAG: putative toxin-antitoxin system toxin component, PIN family [Nanoarchaeota archaeon]